MAYAVLFGLTPAGCIAEDGSFQEFQDDDVAGGEEAVGEVAQALDTCTPLGTGGGTWGDILTLCRTPANNLYVKKRSGSFTSSGTMKLKTWLGTIYTTTVFPGATTVYFGPQLPGWYYAVYESNAPGTAYTGEIQVR
ncbi:hypothetical protein WME89_28845 [Sorangium sp. So ce321]|uniref:hypothetical protein n=1 Tax=Sorangium sp. So ce321 TaxID=3133300 RepID=UPI003F5E2D0B